MVLTLFLLFIVSFFLRSCPPPPRSASPGFPPCDLPPPSPGPSLSFTPLRPDRGGEPSLAAHQSKSPVPSLPLQVPPHDANHQSRSAPAPPDHPIADELGRRRPAPPARPRLRGRRCWASAFSQRRRAALALGRGVGSAGAGAAARRVLCRGGRRGGAAGRPEGRLSSAGARGAGPRTEREEAAPSLPGAGLSGGPEGSWPDVSSPERPQRASRRGRPELPAAAGRVRRLLRLTCAGRRAPECGGVCSEGASPGRQRGGGGSARRPRPHRSACCPQSHRSARHAPPRDVSYPGTAGRDAAGQRGHSRAARHPRPCSWGQVPLPPRRCSPGPLRAPARPSSPTVKPADPPAGPVARTGALGLRSLPARPPPPPSGRDPALVF